VTANSDNLVEFEEDFTIVLSLVTTVGGTNLTLGNSVTTVALTVCGVDYV
jgi:hypothetical protein